MKTAGIAAMGVAAVIFLTALLFADRRSLLAAVGDSAGGFSVCFHSGRSVCDRFRSGYLPTDPKLAQRAREARDAELGLDLAPPLKAFEAG